MDAEAAIRNIRLIAVDQLVGDDVGSNKLIRVGLDALLAGVDSPSLPLLAGLGRRDEPEAHDLFRRVVEELDLVPQDLPEDLEAREWALVRWFAQLIVAGDVDPATGARLIWWHSDHVPVAYVESLRPLLSRIALYDDEISSWSVWDADYVARNRFSAAEVVNEARIFLDQV